MHEAALSDIAQARKKMRECAIKVYEDRKTKLGIEVENLCRGYHHKLSILWELIEAEIEQRSYTYLGLKIEEKGALK